MDDVWRRGGAEGARARLSRLSWWLAVIRLVWPSKRSWSASSSVATGTIRWFFTLTFPFLSSVSASGSVIGVAVGSVESRSMSWSW